MSVHLARLVWSPLVIPTALHHSPLSSERGAEGGEWDVREARVNDPRADERRRVVEEEGR